MRGLDLCHRSRWASLISPRLTRPLRTLRRFAHDTSGSTVTLVAVLSPVLIGGMGLGAETSYWYFTQRALQHAADVSAHAAGVRNRSGDTEAQMEAAALDIAAKAGFTAENSTLELHWPPASGASAGNDDAVEVVLTRTMPRLFSSIYSDEPVTVRGRAVAFVGIGSDACVLALAPNEGAALNVTGSANLNLEGCDVASNSMAADSFSMAGAARLSARCAHAVGGAATTARLTLTGCEEVHEYAPVTPDPYRSVAEPALPPCNTNDRNLGNPNSSRTVTPGPNTVSGMPVYHFCGGLTAKGNVTFQPGLYIISGGDFGANAGAEVHGEGVTFFITSPNKMSINGHAELHLSAPTAGELAGLVFFGSRAASNITHKVNGTSDTVVKGAVYFPSTSVEFSGNSNTGGGGGCTQVIGYTVKFTGNSALVNDCTGVGTQDIEVNRFVSLVE